MRIIARREEREWQAGDRDFLPGQTDERTILDAIQKAYEAGRRDALADLASHGLTIVPIEPTPQAVGAWYRTKNGRHIGGQPIADTSDYAAYRALAGAAAETASFRLRRLSGRPVADRDRD
jgi:hypothetical protein